MNKDDEIREELSDLWCKEITGQLKGSEKIRLQNLIEEREFPFRIANVGYHVYVRKRSSILQ